VTGSCLALAAIYSASILAGAAWIRVPREGWWPRGVPMNVEDDHSLQMESMHYDAALRTPQFWLCWALVLGNAMSGITLISSAKTIMADIYSAALPSVVTAGFATQYVSSLGLANSAGRAGWALASDYLGSRNTYFVFATAVPLVAMIPALAHNAAGASGVLSLCGFYSLTLATTSFYGGNFSCLPPYLAKTFGPKHMGAIHGRILSAWAISAVAGPKMLSVLRDRAKDRAITDLVERVDSEAFTASFGSSIENLAELKEANTVTISRLLEIAPSGTLDPTPTLYDESCYVMCGVLTISAIANVFIRPVWSPKPPSSK